ncbi:MAG: hypothetical protein U9Q81_14610 [Pseudomonadota bacterium]|nr:hypothetical protein [Pseudomonadota bacterium]
MEVRFPVTGAWLTFAVIAVMTVIYYFGSAEVQQAVTFFAACTAGGGAILAAFYASRSLRVSAGANARSAREAEERDVLRKKENAIRFGRRWNAADMYHVRDVVREIFDCSHGKEKTLVCVTDEETNVIQFLNFLEEIAISIEADVGDKDLVRIQFEGIAVGA